MRPFIARLCSNTFLRQNTINLVGSLAVSFLNYLYYPVLGRLLTPADFGETQTIISFFLQTGVFLSVLGLVTIGVVKRYPDADKRNEVLAEIERFAMVLGVVFVIVAILISPWLKSFLNFTSIVPFLLLAFSVLLGIPAAFSNAYIQANQRFGVLSVAGLMGAGTKLLSSAGLVLAGLRSTGAVLGVVCSQVVSLAFTLIWARRLGRPTPTLRLRWPRLSLVRPELRYAGLVLITSLAVNVLLSIDIVVVKHYFSPNEAGLYAGIATIARIIFFLTGPIAGVLIASVALGKHPHNRALLRRSLALIVALGGATLMAFCLWPSWVVALLLGGNYTSVAYLLPSISAAIFLLSVANLLVYYHVALRSRAVLVASVIGLVVTAMALSWHHGSLEAVITSLIIGSATLLIAILGLTTLEAKHG